MQENKYNNLMFQAIHVFIYDATNVYFQPVNHLCSIINVYF